MAVTNPKSSFGEQTGLKVLASFLNGDTELQQKAQLGHPLYLLYASHRFRGAEKVENLRKELLSDLSPLIAPSPPKVKDLDRHLEGLFEKINNVGLNTAWDFQPIDKKWLSKYGENHRWPTERRVVQKLVAE